MQLLYTMSVNGRSVPVYADMVPYEKNAYGYGVMNDRTRGWVLHNAVSNGTADSYPNYVRNKLNAYQGVGYTQLAVDGDKIIQLAPLNVSVPHCGNFDWNNGSVGVEIFQNNNAGEMAKAMENIAYLMCILEQRGEIPAIFNKAHQELSPTSCPNTLLNTMGWKLQQFKNHIAWLVSDFKNKGVHDPYNPNNNTPTAGTYKFLKNGIMVKGHPTYATNSDTGLVYNKDMTVVINDIIQNENAYWGKYTSTSGKVRYVALDTVDGSDKYAVKI